MPRDNAVQVQQPIFHEPVFADTQNTVVPSYFTVPHPGDQQIYDQINDLLKKDVVGFPKSRVADDALYTLESTYGTYAQAKITEIQNNGQLVFDILGDSGASTKNDFPHELAVAGAVTAYIQSTAGRDRPSFMFHLGDLIYDFGEAEYYFDQFYSPFRNYAAPIIAIPGNHDSFVVPGTAPEDEPLKTYMRNFCAQEPTVTAEAGSLHRTAMTEPGVYFALDAPFIRIIAMFSNALEDPGVISNKSGEWGAVPDYQLSFLNAQLQKIKDENYQGAVVIATHHPSFSYAPEQGGKGAGGTHGSSTQMLVEIDSICKEVGVYPHAVLAGHAHNMQRYTRKLNFAGGSIEVPFIVGGASGHHVNPLVRPARGGVPQGPQRGSNVSYMDRSTVVGNTTLTLEQYDDTDFGYLRATVTKEVLSR
jgi:hypothetical protein